MFDDLSEDSLPCLVASFLTTSMFTNGSQQIGLCVQNSEEISLHYTIVLFSQFTVVMSPVSNECTK